MDKLLSINTKPLEPYLDVFCPYADVISFSCENHDALLRQHHRLLSDMIDASRGAVNPMQINCHNMEFVFQ